MTIKIEPKNIHLISSKIKIGQATEISNSSPKNNHFYPRYSRFVLKALRRCRFQEFVNVMLKLEGIDENNVNSVKIELYPIRKRKGSGIAGKCNPFTGKIYIYPKNRKFCDAFSEKYGKNFLIKYAGNRARASLIHELLHLKYTSDEVKVRALTKTYFFEYMQRTYNCHLGFLSLFNLVFGN